MPTVNKNKQISGGALFSTDSDHILTTADQIYDEQRGCYVNEYDFSGNVKSVNGELPDQNGNIKLPIYYFYKNTGETVYKCLDGLTNVDLTTQELQNLYSQIINYVPNEVNNTYLFNSRIPLTVSIINGNTVQFIGADQDLYRENALNYIQINLNASGEITGNEITLPYIKNLQISNNNLVVETNTTTKNIPLPEGGKIDNISFQGSNLPINNKVVTLPEITLTAWNSDSDNATTIKVVGQVI